MRSSAQVSRYRAKTCPAFLWSVKTVCFCRVLQMSLEDFTMYGGAFGNKQDSVFPNLEVS